MCIRDRLWEAAGVGWRRAISGRGWVAVEHLVDGWVRVWEVTHGANGWHVHVHLVVVLPKGSTAADLEVVASGMFERWSRGLQASGLDAPRRVGQDWHIVSGDAAAVELGDYLSKMADSVEPDTAGLGLELTHTMPGRSAEGLRTRPVWSLLDDLVQTGEAVALERWREWERGSKGRKQVGWSVGLRERFAPDVEEATDDDIAGQELGSRADDVLRLDLDAWRELVRVPGRPLAVIEALEAGGVSTASSTLRSWGIAHELLDHRPPSPDSDGVAGAASEAGAGHRPEPEPVPVLDSRPRVQACHGSTAGGRQPGFAPPPVTIDQVGIVVGDRAAIPPPLPQPKTVSSPRPEVTIGPSGDTGAPIESAGNLPLARP